MESSDHRIRVNLKSFLVDYVRGQSEDELRDKYALPRSQLSRVVGILKKKGKITDKEKAQRAENLKIRFGTADSAPKTATYRKGDVELDSGLVLHCPGCGAAVKRGAETCEYCRAHLDFSLKGKTLICPHCFAKTSADGRFCMRCAKPVKGLVHEGKILEDRLCPRCGVYMRGKSVGDFSVIECPDCAGVFVPHETFEMMQERRDGAIFATQRIRRTTVEPEKQIQYVRCPVCRNMMNRENFARISGVIIDTCRDHGIWFDPGEIEKIMDFIARGGLQKAKAVEVERMKDEEKLMRLRNVQTSQQQGGGFAMYGGGFESSQQEVDIFDVVGRLFRLF